MYVMTAFLTIWSCSLTCLRGTLTATHDYDSRTAREQSHTTALGRVHGDFPTPFDESLATLQFDWKVICLRRNGWDSDGAYCTYTYQKVECDREGSNTRAVKVFCQGHCIKMSNDRMDSWFTDTLFRHHCPERTFCEPILLINDGKEGAIEGPIEEVGCTEEEDVKTDVWVAGTSHRKRVHCGLSLQLPGYQFHASANPQPMKIILTEHVHKADGTPLKVPQLFIRDTTNPKHKFDRVMRQDASIASAVIEIGVYRGRLQQQTYEFCMQMVPKAVASSAVFVYSYIKVPHGRPLVPYAEPLTQIDGRVNEHLQTKSDTV